MSCNTRQRAPLILVTLVVILMVLLALPAVAGAAVSYSAEELAFLSLINQHRQTNGLGTLMLSDVLSDSSDKHNLDMGHYDFFGHITQGSDYFAAGALYTDRMVSCGYDRNAVMGENIAAGAALATAEAVFQAWEDSPGHDANMLNASFKVIGISLEVVQGSRYTCYWTTDFGGFVDPSAHDPRGSPSTTTTTAFQDTTPPEVSLSTPRAGAQVAGSVTVTANARDNVGVARVEIWVDGVFAAKDTLAPYSFVWDTKQGADGNHSVEARAFDAAGNVATATAAVTVANQQPSGTTAAATTTTTRPPTTTTTTHPPTTTTTSSTSTTSLSAARFVDVSMSNRFYREISTLAAASIVSGYPDDTFRPDNQVVRAQFAKIMMLALGRHTETVEGIDRPTFPDVLYDGAPYPFDFVEEAVALGIIQGNQDGTFGPYQRLTRAQLALVLVRAGGAALKSPPAGFELPFVDVPSYLRDSVAVALYNQLLSGKTNTTFDPYGLATRGQVAKMVYQLIERMRS